MGSTQDGQTAEALSALNLSDAGTGTPEAVPTHRSHDPANNLKRSDPFQFGSRLLETGDDVFEFNAWDHVEADDAYKEHILRQLALQRQSPVSDFDRNRFNSDPAKWWNMFYKSNTSNFFKDRKWLQQEFPVLARVTKPSAGPITLLEIGAGAGNTAFPVLANNDNPGLKIHACDFSKTAVEVMRKHKDYADLPIQADVWDVAGADLPPGLDEGSVDVAVMIFIFSALSPREWHRAVRNVHRLLKPGGEVCFRDYGRGDLAQVRFRKGRYMEENFYIRGDGTRVYFFDRDELADVWRGKHKQVQSTEPSETQTPEQSTEPVPEQGPEESQEKEQVDLFEIDNLGVDRRMLVNRAEKIKMYRCWLQGRFRKI